MMKLHLLLLSALLALLCACSSSDTASSPSAPAPASATTAAPSKALIGVFTIHVDPSATSPMTLVPSGLSAASGATLTSMAAWSGPGTWDEPTHTLSATVKVQSLDTTYNWDEPSMEVLSITTNAPLVQFKEVNAGTFTNVGTGGPGSSYAFADIEMASSSYNYALQKVTIYDPSDLNFNFAVALYATQTTSAVVADKDHDGWNTETGPAGGDCDDNDPTKYPGGGTCSCGSSSASCLSCASFSNCCSVSSAASCGDGCTCTEALSAHTTDSVSCGAGSVCAFTVSGKHNSTISACGTGSSCSMACSGTGTQCTLGGCVGASCSITASGKASNATITSCASGSTCSISCDKGTTCDLTCTDSTSSCVIRNCGVSGQTGTVGGTCAIHCPGGVYTICSGGASPPYYTCGAC